MKAGFGWENGPFEIWDAIGVEKELKSWKPKVLSLLLGLLKLLLKVKVLHY
jgi:hypothetical protein